MHVVRIGFVDHAALLHHVGQAVGHPRVGGQAVAARAAGLLVVTLQALGQIEVRNEADVRLVDAHAESDGRHHHDALLLAEDRLMAGAHVGIHPGVIRQRADALLGQPLRGLFHLLARQAIDDAGVAGVAVHVLGPDEAQQLLPRAVLLDDGVADVRAVEAREEDTRVRQRQPLDDLVARDGVGRGGQRNARHVRETLVQHGKLDVLRPEIVPPLRHAVRFVDGEQADARSLKQIEEARRHQPLGRHVDEVQPPGRQIALDLRGLGARQRGVEVRGAHAGFFQRGHLVLHQRDQRRNHNAGALPTPVPHECRYLIAKRFAAAGGHQHQAIAAVGDVRDDLRLRAAEGAVAEHIVQHRMRGGGGVFGQRLQRVVYGGGVVHRDGGCARCHARAGRNRYCDKPRRGVVNQDSRIVGNAAIRPCAQRCDGSSAPMTG